MESLLPKVKAIFEAYLKAHKQRRTATRFRILEEIYNAKEHLDAETLYFRLRSKKVPVSRATVYNTLELLVDAQLIIKHQFGQGHAVYERAYGSSQHDHLICLRCNKIIEFCDPRIAQIQKLIEERYDFEIQKHSLILFGYCRKPNCENLKR